MIFWAIGKPHCLPFANGFETREANRTLSVRLSALCFFQGGRDNGFQAERFDVGLLIARSAELNGHGYNITNPTPSTARKEAATQF
jgi:hypothetical protein